jgi:ribosomal protein L11
MSVMETSGHERMRAEDAGSVPHPGRWQRCAMVWCAHRLFISLSSPSPLFKDMPMRVKLYAYNDGSYNFTTHLPQTSWFIKKSCAGGLEKGAGQAGHEEVGMIHVKQLFEIAKLKSTDSEDLSLVSLPNIFKTVMHQCRGMGVKVDFRNEEDFKEEAAKNEPKKVAAAAAAAPKKKK